MSGARRLVGLGCALVALCSPAAAAAHDDGATQLGPRAAAETISSDGGRGPVHLRGTVERIHAHDGDFEAEFFWALSTPGGPIPLRVTDAMPETWELDRVTIDGELRDGVLVADAGDIEVVAPPVASAGVAPGPRNLAVVLYYVSPDQDADMVAPPDYFTKSFAADAAFNPGTASNSVNNYFKTETFGHVSFPGGTGDVFGPYKVEDPPFDPTHAGCHFLNWWTRSRGGASGTDAGSAYEQARDEYDGTHGSGAFDAHYQHVAYTILAQGLDRGFGCGGGGVGEQPGSQVWVDGPDPFLLYHELGHNLGSGHAHTAQCTSGAAPVMYADGCDSPSNPTYTEYGDPFDPMGGIGIKCAYGCEMNASRKLGFGALAGGAQTITADGTFTVAPLETASGLRLLRIPKPDGRFFDVSVRAPIGVFDGSTSPFPGAGPVLGVSVHSDDADGYDSYMIDAHPETGGDLSDGQFQAGETFAPYPGTSVTVNSLSATGASISVDVPDAPKASCIVPKVKGKKLKQAKKLIADASCNLGKVKKKQSKMPQGKVLKQKPKPGTDAGVGGAVKLTVAR